MITDIKPLLTLIKNSSHAELSLLKRKRDPVLYLVANELVIAKGFYRKLAEKYRVGFFDDIPVSINPNSAIVQQVPSHLLLENKLFVIKDKKEVIFVSSTPFVNHKIVNKILSYTGCKKWKLAISSPAAITEALNLAYYQDLHISAEEKIHALHPTKSTQTYTTLIIPRVFPILIFMLLIAAYILFPLPTFYYSFIVLNIVYFVVNPFKFYGLIKSFNPYNQLSVSKNEIAETTDEELPIYTILVPLKKESVIVPKLVESLSNLDYPKDKLDIKFIVDNGDEETLSSLNKLGIGTSSEDANSKSSYMELILVPPGKISTKPRACDYALGFARGAYTVIYDAEDRPDRDQLKKAYIGFNKSTLDTICLQAKLNYYNRDQNILTRLFSLEYGFWFDFFLIGLQKIKSPIPLGGTSNHFVTSVLKRIGTWDPYNVTEDADLGMRIFRYNYKTAVLDSYTLEEANSKMLNWIRQRTRWQKGFLLTFLVHTSRPIKLIKDVGVVNALNTVLIFGSSYFLPLFNLILWIVFILSFTDFFGSRFDEVPLVRTIALLNLIVGNGVYIFIHIFSAIKSDRKDLIFASMLLPVYWMLISLATYRATYQFIRKPYYWEKTIHGLSSS